MNQDQILSLIRSVLKTVGAAAVTKGFGDSSVVEAVIGAVVAIVGFWLSHRAHTPDKAAQ